MSTTQNYPQVSPALRFSFLVCFTAMLAASFLEFSPLVYGMRGDQAKFSNSTYHHLYWADCRLVGLLTGELRENTYKTGNREKFTVPC